MVLPGEGSDEEFPGDSPGESNSKQSDLSISESSGEQVGSSVSESSCQKVGVGCGECGGEGVFASLGQGDPEQVALDTVGEGRGQQVGLCLGQGNLQ